MVAVAVKEGDVVRVVLEGPVTKVSLHDSTFYIGDQVMHYIYPTSEHIKAVEVVAPAKREWKVGDVISDDEYQDESIPNGTLVEDGHSPIVKIGGYWVDTLNGERYRPVDLCDDRLIAFLPK